MNLLLNTQSELKTRKSILANRLSELKQTLIGMPDPKEIESKAELLRLRMELEYQTKDWHTLSYEDIRQFLHFLFSDNPQKNEYGIFVAFKDGKWYVHFNGSIDFGLGLIITDKAANNEIQAGLKKINAETKEVFEKVF